MLCNQHLSIELQAKIQREVSNSLNMQAEVMEVADLVRIGGVISVYIIIQW